MPGAGCWEIPTPNTEPSRSSVFQATIQNARGNPADRNIACVQNGPAPLPFILQDHLVVQCTHGQMQDIMPTEGRNSKGVSWLFACLFRGCKHRSTAACSTAGEGQAEPAKPYQSRGLHELPGMMRGGTRQKSPLLQDCPFGRLQLCTASWAKQSFWLMSSLNATSILP